MPDVKTSQPESLLNRDELREIERFQAKFAELELQLHNCVDEFLSVLNRHYFNRENGYLREQQENLREIVTIQSKLDALAGNMSTGAAELKKRMLEFQQNIQGQSKRASESTGPPDESKPEENKPSQPSEQKKASGQSSRPVQNKSRKVAFKGLVVALDSPLSDNSVSGGEISLRLVFEGLRLTDPSNAEVLNEISSALRKLLYDRKLVGYSKSSLVFGKNRTVGEVLDDLSPVFLADNIVQLLAGSGMVDPGAGAELKLACNDKRELVYIEGE